MLAPPSTAVLSSMETSPRWGASPPSSGAPCCSYSVPRPSRRGACKVAAVAQPRRVCGSAPSARSVGRKGSPPGVKRVNASASDYFSMEALDEEVSGAAQSTAEWDVVGLGQAIIDFSANVDERFLDSVQVEKGGRRVISVEERGEIIGSMDTDAYKINAGGSLSNTLVALARLGEAAHDLSASSETPIKPLSVGLAGMLGDDHLGEFFSASMASARVSCLSEPEPDSSTGTVFVLTTSDANRSFLSYPGTSDEIVLDPSILHAIRNCRILVVEGYLWEFPDALASIRTAIDAAHEAGAVVALTAGDPGLVARHRDALWGALRHGADMLFTNAEEAAQLLGDEGLDAEACAARLGAECPMCVVTDGSRGSYIAALGRLQCIPPHWVSNVPVDTCGAGDAYAAGLLYGMLRGYDLRRMGQTAAVVASAVIGQMGARLGREDATRIASALPSGATSGAKAMLDEVVTTRSMMA